MAGRDERRAALVTGAGSGIGLSVTQRLRRDGLDVLGVDLDPMAAGGESLAADLATRAGNLAAVDEALRRFGRLDVIVASAGYQHQSPLRDFDPDHWDALLRILLTSPFLLAKYGWDALAAAPQGGRFIAIASVHSLTAAPFKSAYVSAKHGLLGLIKTIAVEGAEQGIISSAICPSYVRTARVEQQISELARLHRSTEQQVMQEHILANQAIKRLLEPDEIAETVALLTGPAGHAFTGSALAMDHGWTAS
jgi:3-hydroxybutyrate dehydrogenase